MQPDRDLDRELRDLGPRVEYPPVPDLARSARRRLETEAGSPGSPARSRPQLWWIAAAALVLLVAVPVLSLAVRGMGGGAFSGGAGGAAGGVAMESGGQEANGDSEPNTANGTSDEPDPTVAQGESEEGMESGLQDVKTPNEKPVPNVVGAPVLKACSTLRSKNYVGYVLGEVKDNRFEPGHVVSQKPRAGQKGFDRQPVELIVSEPYPADKLGRDRRCYDLTEYGPGGRPNVPNNVPDRP